MKFIILSLGALTAASPALAAPGDPLPQGALQAVDYELTSAQGLDRAYYFLGDNHTLRGTGERERYIDPSYCAAPDPVQPTAGGGFTITVREPSDDERTACHLKAKESFVSGLVTTQHSFSSTYGYWSIRANLPGAMRTWPAFWLLPTAKTAANGGSVPEIDVFEEYAGILNQGGNPPSLNDRTGRPISTIHPLGGPAMSCGETPTYVAPGTWHTYGVLWEPTKMTFYVDEVETCEKDIAVSDPHYLLVNVAMDGRGYTPGPTSPAEYPATMAVDWVRHQPLSAP
jgi:beta-glucanase (GH16 family)